MTNFLGNSIITKLLGFITPPWSVIHRRFAAQNLLGFSIAKVVVTPRLLHSRMTSETAPSCKVVLAGTIAEKLQQEVNEGRDQLNHSPLLVGFLANNDPAARMYANWTAKTCSEQ